MSKERCEQLIEAGRTQRAALAAKIEGARADFDAADAIYALAVKQAEEVGQALEIAGKHRDEMRAAEEALDKREAGLQLALGDLQDAVLEYGAAELLGQATNEADQQDAREILARAAEYEALAATVIEPPAAPVEPTPAPAPVPVPVVPAIEATLPPAPAELPPLPDVPPLPEPAPAASAAPAPVPPLEPPVS